MNPQIITTEGGEELVVIPRRDYDALLARLGDEEAEDRATVAMAAEARERIASGAEGLVAAGPDGRPPRPEPSAGHRIKVARRERKMTQQQLAAAANIGQGYLSEIENGTKPGSEEVLRAIALALDIDATTLVGRG